MVKGILRVNTRTREARIENTYRTEEQVSRSLSRMKGENTSRDIAFLRGNVIRVSDALMKNNEDVVSLVAAMQTFGGWVILSSQEDKKIQDSFTVFVPGNLDTFIRQCGQFSDLEIDYMLGPLPLREHVEKYGADLPDGKYETRKKKEEERLALQSIRDSETFQDAVLRAREVIGEKRHLINLAQMALSEWRGKK
jgi:hypothetical protein